MKSGSSSRCGAFALIAFTLGGSVMLMASRPHGSTVRAVSGTTISALTTKCEEFWGGDLDPNGKGKGPHLILYRNRRAVTGTSMDLFKGEMIGALENTSITNDDPIYGTKLGHKNLLNKVHGKGCISFRRTSPTTNDAVAWFHPRASDDSVPLEYAMYCPNHPSRNGKVPEYSPISVGCRTATLTYRGVSTTLSFPPGARFVGAAAKKELEQQLTSFNPADRAAIVAWLTASGAWYPCDSNGCCRAS